LCASCLSCGRDNGRQSVRGDPSPDASFLAALDRPDVIQTVSAGNPGFGMSGAAEFTTLAEHAYCPRHPGEPAAQQPPPSWYQIQFPIITPGAG
jgi:hypothetical protein